MFSTALPNRNTNCSYSPLANIWNPKRFLCASFPRDTGTYKSLSAPHNPNQ